MNATIIPFKSSRDYDIISGICIGRGYTVETMPGAKNSALFTVRVNAKLSERQIEFIRKQAAAMRDTGTYKTV